MFNSTVYVCLGLMRNYLLFRNKELPQHLNCPSAMIAIRSPRKSASSLKINRESYSYYSVHSVTRTQIARLFQNQPSLTELQFETGSGQGNIVKDTNAIFKINSVLGRDQFPEQRVLLNTKFLLNDVLICSSCILY